MKESFLHFTIIASGVFGVTGHAREVRPGILFCFADDRGRHASTYAKLDGPGGINDAIETPNLDRIAREGVLFRSAFVSAPSFTPCRSALLSGQHFWRTGRGSTLQGAVWDYSNPSYPSMLHDGGYKIGKSYKVWGPGTPNDAPYGESKFAYEKAGGRFNTFSQSVTSLVAGGKDIEAAKQEFYDEVAINFDAFLADRKPDQPFCYWFGPTETNRTWTQGSGKALWGMNPDSLTGKMLPSLPDVPQIREDIADYFGVAQAFDGALGIFLKKLEAIGELDNTLIVASGDHCVPGFPHGKCNLYDFGCSVALAICGAGTVGGRVVDDLIASRSDPKWKEKFEVAFGKRTREESYDLKKEPDQTRNLAASPEYAESRPALEKRVMDELRSTGDPRVVNDGKLFETPPMSGPLGNASAAESRKTNH